jgi:hypothetical protein
MANYYWVGGTAQWSGGNSSAWASTSGGGGGAGIPTSADNVYFDANSGSVTVTVGGGRSCYNLDMTGFTGVITAGPSNNITVYGTSIILPSSVGLFDPSNNPGLVISPTLGATTLETKGQTIGNVTINNGTLTLVDELVAFNNSTLTLSGGTFNANNKNVTMGKVVDSDNTTAKVLTMGSGVWTLGATGPANNADYVWNIQAPTYFTLNKDTSKIRLLRYQSATSLRTAITDTTSTSIVVNGALPQGSTTTNWSTSGTVLIDDEQITYTGLVVTDNMNATLTGCTRGANNTTATTHPVLRAVLLLTPPGYTTLTSNIDSSTTSIPVTDNTAFGSAGTVLIDNEVIIYTSKASSTSFDGLTRNSIYGSTTDQKHNSKSLVRATEARIFSDGAKSYPTIEVWSSGNYQITNFTGNGTSSGGGISNMTFNNLGPQQVQFGTYMSPTSTYYANQPMPLGNDSLLMLFF